MLPSVWGRRIHRSSSAAARRACFRPRRSTRCSRRCARGCRSSPDAEITLEANPGTAEAARFRGYRDAGVNRLSLGVQSFDDAMLKALGRIHSADEARRAIGDGAGDLRQREHRPDVRPAGPDARDGARRHRGRRAPWRAAPVGLPAHDRAEHRVLFAAAAAARSTTPRADMQVDGRGDARRGGLRALRDLGLRAGPGQRCRHNLNYWEFGDYLGIGAGAHGKLSFADRVTRHERVKQPREYLAASGEVPQRAIEAKRTAVRIHAERIAPGRRFSGGTVRRSLRTAVSLRSKPGCRPRRRRA